jgi:hypothetical protein
MTMKTSTTHNEVNVAAASPYADDDWFELDPEALARAHAAAGRDAIKCWQEEAADRETIA